MKRLIIVISIIAIGLAIWAGADYLLSRREVRFDLRGSGYTVEIVTEDGKKVTKIDNSSNVTLEKGAYFYIIAGTNYQKEIISFHTNDNQEITVTPKYLESYRLKLLEQERAGIIEMISKRYSATGNITVKSLSIHETGAWAYGKINLNDKPNDIYRFILKKKDDSWEFTITPTIAINKSEAPSKDIPLDIVYDLYKQDIM